MSQGNGHDKSLDGAGSGNGSDQQREPVLQFPTDYPIKVLGRPSDEFRAHIHAIFLKHVPAFDVLHTHETLSEHGKFVSISYTIRAESREQVIALATDLKAFQDVVMVI